MFIGNLFEKCVWVIGNLFEKCVWVIGNLFEKCVWAINLFEKCVIAVVWTIDNIFEKCELAVVWGVEMLISWQFLLALMVVEFIIGWIFIREEMKAMVKDIAAEVRQAGPEFLSAINALWTVATNPFKILGYVILFAIIDYPKFFTYR
jgi:hypothetical protein